MPRSSSQSIFEGLSRKAVLGVYAVPAPLPWDMILRQWFSSLLSLRLTCGVSVPKPHPPCTRWECAEPTCQGFWAQLWLRTMFKVQLWQFTGTTPTVQWARTYIWTAKNYLYLYLFLTQIPLHHGGPQERECEQQSGFIWGSRETSKDRVLMRKEVANEKRINPNLSFPSTARNVKFHKLYVLKLILKWSFYRKVK